MSPGRARLARVGAPAVAAAALCLAASGTVARAEQPPKLPSTVAFVVSDPSIDEASGMTASRLHEGVVYIVEDSRNGPTVFAVDRGGDTAATFTLAGAINVDWEAMAPGTDGQGNPTLWIGDIGDNDSERASIRLYRVDEPSELVDGDLGWSKIDLTYPDRPHNAEALLADPTTGRLYVVTKEALGAGVYATPTDLEKGGEYELTRVGDAPMFVTDGAISPDGAQTVLRTYANAVVTDGPGGSEVARYRLPPQPQGETLAFTPDGRRMLIGSEGTDQPVYLLDAPPVAADDPTPSDSATESPDAGADPASSDSGNPALAVGIAAVVLLSLIVGAVMARRRRS